MFCGRPSGNNPLPTSQKNLPWLLVDTNKKEKGLSSAYNSLWEKVKLDDICLFCFLLIMRAFFFTGPSSVIPAVRFCAFKDRQQLLLWNFSITQQSQGHHTIKMAAQFQSRENPLLNTGREQKLDIWTGCRLYALRIIFSKFYFGVILIHLRTRTGTGRVYNLWLHIYSGCTHKTTPEKDYDDQQRCSRFLRIFILSNPEEKENRQREKKRKEH